ncbi:hypothetical protein SEEE4220_18284, partial [Salmonella enterica subsp. enterica serovar Enteritidis str. 543463 42-20]
VKVARVGRIIKTAAVAGAENAALEAILASGDYQKGADDVLAAAGFGMIMGGTIGAATRERIARKPGVQGVNDGAETVVDDLDTVVKGADEFDASAAKAVREAMEYDAYMAVRSYEPLRAKEVDMDVAILSHLDDLKANSSV